MPLSREEAFDLWAGPASTWSVWSKPILFSYLPPLIEAQANSEPPAPQSAPWAPHADGSTVLVIDLPGVRSVRVGETLAHMGFRPIPLFNAVPGPRGDSGSDSLTWTAVDVNPIIDAIAQATLRLRDRLEQLPASAPPAFLLHADRRLGRVIGPGDFDNRSVSLPTDFPSATFLQSHGVTRAVVILDSQGRSTRGGQPATDLAHTLLRWQTGGISILSCLLDENLDASSLQTITVARPSWFGAIWHNALSVVGLRRNLMGGFGGTLPVPSAG